jgi:phage terminase small subunit
MSEENSKALTDKQQMFCEHYLISLNATKAAKLAGYSEATAYASGAENLRKPEIRAYIDERLNNVAMSANEVLARLTAQARADIRDVLNEKGEFDFNKGDQNDAMALVAEIEQKEFGVKVKMVSSQQAIVTLARYHGMLTDRQVQQHEFGADSLSVLRGMLGVTPPVANGDPEKS